MIEKKSNVSMKINKPWDEIIQEQMIMSGPALRETGLHYASVRNTISSTCAHIRNLALRRIAKAYVNKTQFTKDINNLCFGTG
jgi:hypothetical protein